MASDAALGCGGSAGASTADEVRDADAVVVAADYDSGGSEDSAAVVVVVVVEKAAATQKDPC